MEEGEKEKGERKKDRLDFQNKAHYRTKTKQRHETTHHRTTRKNKANDTKQKKKQYERNKGEN
jgi:hypothetical protein